MDKKNILIVATLVVAVFAEPPVNPSSQYGPPQGSFDNFNQFASPSQFGASGADRLSQSGRFSGQHGGGSSHHNGGPSFSGYDSASGDGFNGGEGSEPANYEFKYDVEDQDYGVKFGHEENRQGDVAMGAYYVLLPDGRTQHVEYVADQEGYKPMITYEDSQGGYVRGGPSGGGGGGYSNDGPNSGFGRNDGHSRGSQQGGFGAQSSGSIGGYQLRK